MMIRATREPRPQRDIIAIGASAGGVAAISRLLKQLPGELPAAILVVLHRPPEQISRLTHILSRKAHLHVLAAREGDLLQKGVCLVEYYQ
jgi:two-component system chemotaxis response regulator CheB